MDEINYWKDQINQVNQEKGNQEAQYQQMIIEINTTITEMRNTITIYEKQLQNYRELEIKLNAQISSLSSENLILKQKVDQAQSQIAAL